jgi:hypothetical protein
MTYFKCICCKFYTWEYCPKYYPKQKPRASAGGILISHGRVLIVQSHGKKWGFPKGGFEEKEDSLECAMREVHEETSLKIWFTREDSSVKYGRTTFYIQYIQDRPKINLQYIRKPGNDCTGIGWIRLSCLKKLNSNIQLNSGLRKFIDQYMPS